MRELHYWVTGGVIGLLALLAFALLARLLDGTIRTTDMLSSETDGPIDPERLLTMVATVLIGFAYFAYGLKVGAEKGVLPVVPSEVLTGLGGSNLLYIIGKYVRPGGGING